MHTLVTVLLLLSSRFIASNLGGPADVSHRAIGAREGPQLDDEFHDNPIYLQDVSVVSSALNKTNLFDWNPFVWLFNKFRNSSYFVKDMDVKYDIKSVESIALPNDCVHTHISSQLSDQSSYEETLAAAVINLMASKNHTNIIHVLEKIRNKVKAAAYTGRLVKHSVKSAIGLRSSIKYLALNDSVIASRGIKPILVFINRKSGGKMGRSLMKSLRRVLHYAQICDLSIQKPSYFFNLFKNVPLSGIVVCGGDGTISWVMDEQRKHRVYNNTSIGIIPIGTGNDLYCHVITDQAIIEQYKHAKVKELINKVVNILDPNLINHDPTQMLQSFASESKVLTKLDRWTLNISPIVKKDGSMQSMLVSDNSDMTRQGAMSKAFRSLGSKAWRKIETSHTKNKIVSYLQQMRSRKVKLLNNYFGIGVDGAVSMAFDDLRRRVPFLFFHRVINKLWYGLIGLRTFIFGRNKDLSKCITLICDGVPVTIPAGTKGIIALNINSYAGGSKLWQFPSKNNDRKGNDKGQMWIPQSINDGIIEIVGVNGVPHLGQIKAGMANAIPLAQGRKIEIISHSRVPMQLDGEPWMQSPCKIDLTLAGDVTLMLPAVKASVSEET